MAEYKYQAKIDELMTLGLEMPILHQPDEKSAFRFIFKDAPAKNHIPPYISKPKRALCPGVTISGYALSCFENRGRAEKEYRSLRSSHRNIHKSIGDSLSQGIISASDGRISDSNSKTHFDLYEYCECDLSKTFTFQSCLL